MEHRPAVTSITSSEDEGGAEEKREGDGSCWRSVDDGYRIFADLTGFDNLRTMIDTETDNVGSKKRKMKTSVGYGAQEEVTAVDFREEELAEKVHAPECNIILDSIDVSDSITVDVEREKEQVVGVEDVETPEAFKGNDVVKSSVVIDVCSSSTEEDQVEVNVSCCRDAEATVPADTVVLKRRRRRRRRRKKDKMTKTCEPIGSVLRSKKDKIGGTVTSQVTESAGIKDNIVLRKLLRGPRYFDPPSRNSDECLKCGEVHVTLKCTAVSWKKPCCLCGGFEHSWKQCTQGLDCLACKGRGHRAKDCPEKNQGEQSCSEICLRCGESGHDMSSCTTNYSPDDIKEIQCYVCKNSGHLCCVDLQDCSPGLVSCYNCGQSGHLGPDCTQSRGKTRVVRCSKCKEEGHSARRCTKNLKRFKDSTTLAHEMETCRGSNSMAENLNEAPRKNQYEEGVAIITTA